MLSAVSVDALSEYTIEYGTALLMNLSLRSSGKDRCAEPRLDTLSVLSQLMESDIMQVHAIMQSSHDAIMHHGMHACNHIIM